MFLNFPISFKYFLYILLNFLCRQSRYLKIKIVFASFLILILFLLFYYIDWVCQCNVNGIEVTAGILIYAWFQWQCFLSLIGNVCVY